ncbi:MAG: Fumarylacetoacetate hydrolase family protein [uncultured Frankineae bacterium]|uniref:Fumarylacetoacetate hydrolase family protein n=1 Tax=uncultured Frankineae bacterium TaxID=437475 RepID=A0A6J4L5U3_9ACTN|nr:MAG: Fumarylacetoacetate hydrolase family protein [uncultured Frankineae bacterium]
MRIARFAHSGEISYGLVQGGGDDPAELMIATLQGHPLFDPTPTGEVLPLPQVRLLAPTQPINVVCIGKNYADHVREMGGLTDAAKDPGVPTVFLKPATSVVGPGDPVRLPAGVGRVDHEGELAVVIGKPARDLTTANALDHVWGYTAANDVTAREQQKSDGQWTRGKGHDTFCPLGPWLETDLDPSDLRVRCEVDEVLRQDGNTRDLIHDVPSVLAFVTSFMTLLPGDVVLTGTPAGVGPLEPGSTVSVDVEGVGTLVNPVVAR